MEDQLLVLYFEDDLAVAQLVMAFLDQQGFRFCHFANYPPQGLDAIRQQCGTKVAIVILDINMPGKSGYEICELLKNGFLADNVPVLFTSGLMDNDDIMKAFAAGADDYLIKPVRLNELAIKISKLIEQKQQQSDAIEQSTTAMKIAFDAMKNSSELGAILRFHEEVHQVNDFGQLASLSFAALRNFDLESTIVFLLNDQPAYYRDDLQKSQLEFESMLAARAKGRLFSWKKYSFFSYDLFTVLIRNMPIDDEERYGILKDQVCLLLNGIDARCRSILIAQSELEKQQRIASVNKILAQLVLDIEQGNVSLSEKFERIIADMETNIISEITQFSLLDNEEARLLSVVKGSMLAATALFEDSIATEKQRKQVIDVLLAKLN